MSCLDLQWWQVLIAIFVWLSVVYLTSYMWVAGKTIATNDYNRKGKK